MRHENRDNIHLLSTVSRPGSASHHGQTFDHFAETCFQCVVQRVQMLKTVTLLPYSIPFLQAFVASASICFVPTTPFVVASSNASTTASPTTSTLSGFSAIAPRKPSLFPRKVLNSEATNPPRAIGRVNFLLESYMKPGRMKMLRRSGRVDVMVASASLFVVMYRAGSTGAPAAAEMYTKAGTCSFEDSWASAIATS